MIRLARPAEQLRESESYNRGLIEASVDGLITVDADGTITDVNDQMCKMTGYARAELIGTPFVDYFTEPEAARSGVQQTLREGRVIGYELVLVTRHARRITVSFNAGVFADVAGKPQGILAAARDITEQKTLEQQLRDQQSYTRSLIESNIDALMTTEPLGIITDVNEQMEALTDRTREELIGSPFKNYFTDPVRAEQGIQLVLQEDKVTNYELAARSKSGTETVVSYNATTFNDRDGKLQGVFAAARDITETKQASQYARSLIESSLDPLVTISPDGKITDVNDATIKVTGMPRDQLIGTDFSSYFTEPDKAREGYQQVFEKGTVTDYALTIHSTEGKLTDVLYNATVYKDELGQVLGVFAAARDVTERKRFEQTLQVKNVELEKASLAKDRFLASMSHELRTPLNAIIGFTGTLMMKLPGPLNEQQTTQLDTIQSSAQHLLSLINDLLDLAKIESGKVELHPERVVCQSVLQDVTKTLQPQAERKGLTFEVLMPPEDLAILTDRRSMAQILINLANNAIKFTESGGIVIRLDHYHEKDQLWIALHVVDTGLGIRPGDQEKLFQAFEQVGRPDLRPAEGTGLGLHLSQKLANLLGGHISFTSEFGQGGTFTLTLPEHANRQLVEEPVAALVEIPVG